MQRAVLIHSIIYYELDGNHISDREYDLLSKDLVKLIADNPVEASKSYYAKVFEGYNGCSGFDLMDKLTPEHREYLTRIAQHIR